MERDSSRLQPVIHCNSSSFLFFFSLLFFFYFLFTVTCRLMTLEGFFFLEADAFFISLAGYVILV